MKVRVEESWTLDVASSRSALAALGYVHEYIDRSNVVLHWKPQQSSFYRPSSPRTASGGDQQIETHSDNKRHVLRVK